MALNPNILIDTPENLALEAEVAGMGSRLVAALVDYLLVAVGLFLLLWLALASFNPGSGWQSVVLIIGTYALFTFYHMGFEYAWNGQTPGKRLVGVRVVHVNGMPLSTSGLLLRNLVRLFDFFPVLYGFGLIMLFVTRYTQRLGDLAARTIVIYDRGNLTLDNLQEDYAVRYYYVRANQALPDYVDVADLGERDRRLVVDYLNRRGDFVARQYVVIPVAQFVARRMGLDQNITSMLTPRFAEEFLEQVARAFELAEQSSAAAEGRMANIRSTYATSPILAGQKAEPYLGLDKPATSMPRPTVGPGAPPVSRSTDDVPPVVAAQPPPPDTPPELATFPRPLPSNPPAYPPTSPTPPAANEVSSANSASTSTGAPSTEDND